MLSRGVGGVPRSRRLHGLCCDNTGTGLPRPCSRRPAPPTPHHQGAMRPRCALADPVGGACVRGGLRCSHTAVCPVLVSGLPCGVGQDPRSSAKATKGKTEPPAQQRCLRPPGHRNRHQCTTITTTNARRRTGAAGSTADCPAQMQYTRPDITATPPPPPAKDTWHSVWKGEDRWASGPSASLLLLRGASLRPVLPPAPFWPPPPSAVLVLPPAQPPVRPATTRRTQQHDTTGRRQ